VQEVASKRRGINREAPFVKNLEEEAKRIEVAHKLTYLHA
jgi:hypothetical protein